jgi:sRNA-binding regulator protein Hfq
VPNRNPPGNAFRPDDEAPTGNRKLIRPNLSDMAERYPTRTFAQRKQTPPEQTNAESYYYLKQMAAKTPIVVVLNDGEQLRGWIEWYDKGCIKLNRERAPNLLISKASIKYLYKQDEEGARGGNR